MSSTLSNYSLMMNEKAIVQTLAVGTTPYHMDSNSGYLHAFIASLSVIIVSEIGDKTFFIAAILAMRHSRVTVFIGALSALGLMTVFSALLGYATTVIPHWFTHYVSSALFAIFGIKMLKEAYSMGPNDGQEEYEEVHNELQKKEEEEIAAQNSSAINSMERAMPCTPSRKLVYSFFSRVFLQSFTMTFLAEWGDRSQIATIILAAKDVCKTLASVVYRLNVLGVIVGGTLGHALCTGLAVIGGRFVAQRISMRSVHLVGGVVFLIFAVSAFFIDD